MNTPTIPRTVLKNGLEVTKIVNGMWQVSGAHGHIDQSAAVADMVKYYEHGITSFDMADIYGPSEDIFGKFLSKISKEKGPHAVSSVQGLTKWVPRPGVMTRKIVEIAIDTSCKRMGVSSLDCLQFHWWDYSDKRYLDALGHLSDLQKEGKIKELALTNFDTERLREITEKGIKISSNQIQYSLIDSRPAHKMAAFCEANNIKLLTYGTIGGSLISEKYVGVAEPKGRGQLNTASLSKYKNMIDIWGGWSLFQELLVELDSIAKSHGVGIANVATRYILDQPAVGGVIVGCRLGVTTHLEQNLKTFSFQLTQADRDRIAVILSRGNDLMSVIGDCGDEYR